MKPVKQTDITFVSGNCFSACIASILEMRITDVPTFVVEKDWWRATNAWLAGRGLTFVDFKYDDIGNVCGPLFNEVFCILSGPSPRDKTKQHSVVGVIERDPGSERMVRGRMIFDPHPSNDGILSVDYVGFLINVNPIAVAA